MHAWGVASLRDWTHAEVPLHHYVATTAEETGRAGTAQPGIAFEHAEKASLPADASGPADWAVSAVHPDAVHGQAEGIVLLSDLLRLIDGHRACFSDDSHYAPEQAAVMAASERHWF